MEENSEDQIESLGAGEPASLNISIPENVIEERSQSHDMEVHKHTHTPRNKWTHYFWEFLMLFLAVFCGFLAEYKLEHVIENQREATLMRSLTDDLKADDQTLQNYFTWRTDVNEDFDSLLLLLPLASTEASAYRIYKLAGRSSLRFGLPDIHEGTIQQLKNAGGLRLVRNKEVLKAINKHYLSITRMQSVFDTEILLRVKLIESMGNVLDATLLTDNNTLPESYRLFTNDESKVNAFMNDIIAAKSINTRLVTHLDSSKASTLRLKNLIAQEYHFE